MMTLKRSSFLFLCTVVAFFIKHVNGIGGPAGHYSNEWILKVTNRRDGAHSIADLDGFEIVSEKSNGYYVLRKTDIPAISEFAATTGVSFGNIKVEKFEQLRYLNRSTRSAVSRDLNINDAAWSSMWHVHEDTFPSMGVHDAWVLGYTGDGVHINIVDDGVEPEHPDLAANYDEENSYDFLDDTNYVNQTGYEYHGTWCSGVASAVKNDECVIGMAYNSKFSAIKIFDNFNFLTDFGESEALTHGLAHTDIYSNSWGPYDNGEIFAGPAEFATAALKTAITEGRGGLGAIYTWAAGNGGIYDDCNCDGYANSIYTISVTSIGIDQGPSWYSEECSSIMAGTYSGDSPDPGIATTSPGGSCISYFQGTSASCPMGAGIIALALEANPTLTWRDVQHLIVETSVREGLVSGDWRANGAGFTVSHVYGFGLMNAVGMVNTALSWTNVPPQVTCQREMAAINRVSDNGVTITSEHVSNGCDGQVQFLEHVEVWMSFSSTYRGNLMIKLISPSGTQSRLLRPRLYDSYNGTTEWTFMTVHSWGERPQGTWTLQVEATDSTTVYGVDSWTLILHGTQSPPANNPAAQVSEEDDNSTTYAIIGGVVGGVVLFAVVAILVYNFVLKKPKDPTVYPTNNEGADNNAYQQ